MNNLLQFCRLIRLGNVAFVGAFQYLLRYMVVLPTLAIWDIEPALSDWQFALLAIATMALTASGNAINDYFDVRCDSINRPQQIVVDRYISRKATILIHVLLTLVGVFIGLYIAFIFGKETYALFFISIPAMLWFYSTYFKKQILIGNMLVALLTAAVAFVVVSVEIAAIVKTRGPEIINSAACDYAWKYTAAYAFFSFICTLAREIIKDIEDVNGDSQCDYHTLPVEMGIPNSKVVVIILELGMLVALWATYFAADVVNNVPYIAEYILAGITLPSIALCILLVYARDKQRYHNISMLSKYIMLIGTLTIVFVHYSNK